MTAMVGRDRELSEVAQSLTDPDVTLTLIAGEAGIGKSRLVAATVDHTPGRLTLSGSCLPLLHTLPLLPIIDAFDTTELTARAILTQAIRALPQHLRTQIAGVMPRTLPSEVITPEEVRQDQLFIACDALLSRAAKEHPVTLIVEDVHWADPDTLDLLTYLAGARHASGRHLLVTCRTDETHVSDHVSAWLASQRRSAHLREIRLASLEAHDVRLLVAALSHRDGETLDRLATSAYSRGQGNPFFTEQLVASANTRELPSRLASLLSSRIEAVSPAAQAALTVLAVIGRPVPVTTVRLVTEQDEEACLTAVRELEAAYLVTREGGRVRPRHALLAEAVLSGLPGLSTSYHHRVAVALEALDESSTAPEVAEHFRLAGDERSELRVAQVAAQRAWDLGAYPDAAHWYQRVLELHSSHPATKLSLNDAQLTQRTMHALDVGGERLEAIALAERAVHDFADWPNLPERLDLLRYSAHLIIVENKDRGRALLESLLSQFDTLAPSTAHVLTLAHLAGSYTWDGDSSTAVPYLEKAMVVAKGTGTSYGEVNATARMSFAVRQQGDRVAAERYAAEALRIAEHSGDEQGILDALVTVSDMHLTFAQFESAVTAAERGMGLVSEVGLARSFSALLLVNNAAEGHLALGRTEDVATLVDPLTDDPLRTDEDMLNWLRAHADLRRGDVAGALRWISGEHEPVLSRRAFDRPAAEALGYVLLWNQRPEEAQQVLLQALAWMAGGDFSQQAGFLLSLGAQAAADIAESGDPSRATHVAAILDDLRASMTLDPLATRDTYPRATADHHQWIAERTRQEGHSDPAAWTEAAEAWASLSMPHDAAYCWWRAAQALSVTGVAEHRHLRETLHSAHRLASNHLPLRDRISQLALKARIPVLDPESHSDFAPTSGHGLTAQEVRVLELLSIGLTNAEIGVALTISPKTASVHVSNLLRKLQVGNRTEAASWAIRHGLTVEG